MFDGFLFLSLIIFYVKEGIINVFRIKSNNKIVIIIGLIILIISAYLKIVNIKLVVYLLTIILFIHFLLMVFIRKKS